METMFILQDTGTAGMAARLSAGHGDTDGGDRFASTLDRQLDGGNDTDGAAAAAPPPSLRGDLREWLRSLQQAPAATATEHGAASTAAAAVRSALPAVLADGSKTATAGTVAAGTSGSDARPAEPELTEVLSPALDAGVYAGLPAVSSMAAAVDTATVADEAGTASEDLDAGESDARLALAPATPAGITQDPAPAVQNMSKPAADAGHRAATRSAAVPLPDTQTAGSSEAGQVVRSDVAVTAAAATVQAAPPATPDAVVLQQITLAAANASPGNAASGADSARSSTAAAPFALHSEVPGGSEGWSEDIGSKISWLGHQKIGRAELSLHPAELGALDITINHEDDRVVVSIVTRNDAARELLETSMPRLAELLRSSGLALEQGSVSQQGNPRQPAAGNSPNGSGPTGEESDSGSSAPLRRAFLHQGRIDHYV